MVAKYPTLFIGNSFHACLRCCLWLIQVPGIPGVSILSIGEFVYFCTIPQYFDCDSLIIRDIAYMAALSFFFEFILQLLTLLLLLPVFVVVALGLCFPSSAVSRGYSLGAVCRLLIAVASLAVERGLQASGLR